MAALHSSEPRRQFLKLLGVGTPAALALRTLVAATNEKKTVRIVQFDAAGVRTGVVEMEKVEKPLSEWKKQLTAEQFLVTRQAEHGRSRARANTPTTTRTGSTTASAAIRLSSIPRQSSNPERAGPASGSPSRKKMSPSRWIIRWACRETKWCAAGAPLIWAMFLTTVRLPLNYGTALEPLPCNELRRPGQAAGIKVFWRLNRRMPLPTCEEHLGGSDEIQGLLATLDSSIDRLGPHDPQTLAVVHKLAIAAWCAGNIDGAVGLLDQTLDHLTSSFASEHPMRMDVLSTLGEIMFEQRHLEQAGAILREVLECRVRHAGANHPSSLAAKGDLATVLLDLGQNEEARGLARGSLRERPEHTSGRLDSVTCVHNPESRVDLRALRRAVTPHEGSWLTNWYGF